MTLLNRIISNYEVLSKIGEGGMGEVYRARDNNLGRDVAIKVLPAAFAADAERLRRFEQEARSVGALNHPNILVIHQIGTEDGAPYIVSELLEGETLRERMGGTFLPARKVVDYALQVANGLAAAHEKGIVHRDLKPENIFITKDGRAKILDFGLAKLAEPESDQARSEIPTRKLNTDPGTVMGTVGYMSPEQVRGQAVDHRSDIFAFGAILYEMLSGERAFPGESPADVISAILREDPPDLPHTNNSIAPALARVIHHCLEKNPEERFHSARDLAFAIEALSGSAAVSGSAIVGAPRAYRRNHRELIAWVAACALLIGCIALAALYLRRPEADERPARFVVAMPEKATDIAAPVISPDGRTIAFLATSEGRRLIHVRALDSLTAQPLAATEGAMHPFWSPDSRHIGFFSDNKLKRIETSGGPAHTLCDVQSPGGGTWNRDGVILFGRADHAIQRVHAAGGEPLSVLALDESRKEIDHVYPVFLPDDRHFLYYAWNGNPTESAIYVASLDGSVRKLLLKNDSNVAFTQPGHLLFARGPTLMAQSFDVARLELIGEPFPVLENVTFSPDISYSNFSVSENGVMVYWSGANVGRRLTWFDRSGEQIGPVGPAGEYFNVVLAPDEKRAAVQRLEGGTLADIWLMDLGRGVPTRFTFDSAGEDDPAWSPDGSLIVFSSNKDGSRKLYRKKSNGAGGVELVSDSAIINSNGIDWSSDGRYILYESIGQKSGADLWVLPVAGDSAPYPLLSTEFNEFEGAFSPDGRWFAYVSSESGRAEVYVQSFPPSGGKWQISTSGGAQPQWRRDGKELFYIAADQKLMAVQVKPGASFETGAPVELFQTQVGGYLLPNRYDVTADGQRFLVNSTLPDTSQTPITIVLNWTSTLKK